MNVGAVGYVNRCGSFHTKNTILDQKTGKFIKGFLFETNLTIIVCYEG